MGVGGQRGLGTGLELRRARGSIPPRKGPASPAPLSPPGQQLKRPPGGVGGERGSGEGRGCRPAGPTPTASLCHTWKHSPPRIPLPPPHPGSGDLSIDPGTSLDPGPSPWTGARATVIIDPNRSFALMALQPLPEP